MADPTETYAALLRRTGIDRLHGVERKHLQEELDWREENPELRAKMDAMVGDYVYLLRDRKSMGGDISFPAGTRFHAFERWLDSFHVLYNNHIVLAVKYDWVTASLADVVAQKVSAK
jgi:hypothetical protein